MEEGAVEGVDDSVEAGVDAAAESRGCLGGKLPLEGRREGLAAVGGPTCSVLRARDKVGWRGRGEGRRRKTRWEEVGGDKRSQGRENSN